MTHRQIRNIIKANISITNKTLKIDHPYVVYQIRNIATLNQISYEEKRKANLFDVLNIALIYIILVFIPVIMFIIGRGNEIIKQLILNFLLYFIFYKVIVKRRVIFKILRKARTELPQSNSLKEIIEISLGIIKELINILSFEKTQPLYVYGVSISTNDGKKVTIYDYRYELIYQIMESLHEVMENQETPVNYHFVVEGDIIQQSGNFDVGVNQGNIN